MRPRVKYHVIYMNRERYCVLAMRSILKKPEVSGKNTSGFFSLGFCCYALKAVLAFQQSLQRNLSLKTHLGFHADIHKDATILIPTTYTFQIAGAAFVVDDKGSNTMSETFFEHEKSANAAVTIFKWADTFELHMEIQNLVKADIFLRFVFFNQSGHGRPDL